MTALPVCFWCGERLRYRSGEGWVHHGGSVTMMRCDRCGVRAALLPTPAACPGCGAIEDWTVDHAALPRFDEAGAPATVRPVPLRGQGAGE